MSEIKPSFDVHLPSIEPKFLVSALSEVIDWGLRLLNVPDCWKITKGDGVKVAILDTGVDKNHQDLKDQIDDVVDFTGSVNGYNDMVGHGTHCAGIVAAIDNGVGVIGVAPHARLYIGKILNDNGAGDYSWIVQGVNWAIEKGVDIISMSLGGPMAQDDLYAVIKKAYDAGVIIVAAAGNEGESSYDTINYPAKYKEVISVGSIDANMQRSNFSSVGDRIDIMAPGGQVYSCYPGGKYAVLSGTSMATPYISGICALVVSKHRANPNTQTPIKNNDDMRQHLLKATTKKVEDVRKYGGGIINPTELLKEA